MRTTIYLGAATFAAALAVGGTALAGNNHNGNVIRLTAQTVQDAFVDVGSPGPSLGDQIISSDTVFRRGEAVGTDGVSCTIVKATPDALTCNWAMTVALPGGQLTMQGIADGPHRSADRAAQLRARHHRRHRPIPQRRGRRPDQRQPWRRRGDRTAPVVVRRTGHRRRRHPATAAAYLVILVRTA